MTELSNHEHSSDQAGEHLANLSNFTISENPQDTQQIINEFRDNHGYQSELINVYFQI